MKMCNISVRSLKEIVDEWWTEWNLHTTEEVPQHIEEVLVKLMVKDEMFNLTTGEWT